MYTSYLTISYDHTRFEWLHHRKPTKSYTIASHQYAKTTSRSGARPKLLLERRPIDGSHGWREWDNERKGDLERLRGIVDEAQTKAKLKLYGQFSPKKLEYFFRIIASFSELPLYQFTPEQTDVRLIGNVPYEHLDYSPTQPFLLGKDYVMGYSGRFRSDPQGTWDYFATFKAVRKERTKPIKLSHRGEPTILGEQVWGGLTLLDQVRQWFDGQFWADIAETRKRKHDDIVRHIGGNQDLP
jgi:hypothetical protein